ncbi:TraR/DksA C4-type zinc finger protein [Paenibacillus dakarensis]|uniref:TraR/DksA C4-type zinc finger protein n=1 Tax=Paenibacillus dakarensis TaxID=1527293 RepID=UPI0006D57CFF|nr:TraR/DksA C4-type zinc finger protein [Paenibacillus dakarensis]
MKHLSDKQLNKLKHSLTDEKEQLLKHFEQNDKENAYQAEDSLRDSTGELSSADNHPADVGTETYERGRDQAIDETLNTELEQIDNALERIKNGTYGTCEECGKEIPYERLEALPFTSYCIDHASDQSISDYRPVEEDVITPPPSGAGVNRQKADGRFDDAGAWDAVEDYGTATSPAMSIEPGKDDYKKDI